MLSVGPPCHTYYMNTKQTKRINLMDLNANDRFCLPGNPTVMTCYFRRTIGNQTRVEYGYPGESFRSTFTRVNMSSVDLIVGNA